MVQLIGDRVFGARFSEQYHSYRLRQMTDFRRLDVCERAHALTLDLYRATARFPTEERFGLVSQIRRAGVSIGANLAEGSGRGGRDFARYIGIALGSSNELEYLLRVGYDLTYLRATSYQERATEVSRMLAGLRRSVIR
jgi:four helix bundle protein